MASRRAWSFARSAAVSVEQVAMAAWIAAAMMIVFLVIPCGAILLKIRLLDREVHYA